MDPAQHLDETAMAVAEAKPGGAAAAALATINEDRHPTLGNEEG